MPPRDNTYHYQHADSLQERAAVELESMRSSAGTSSALHPMPPACARLLRTLPGNDECVDCGARHPEWATVSYGALICLECSGRHRRLGVQTSTVRSIVMDHWSQEQVLGMLEGGNYQLAQFFARHDMKDMPDRRYKTKAARFYRENLGKHVQQVKGMGFYPGREATRRKPLKHCETV